ncbi:MAG: curli assembly protein CsgF [Alteromonadaceae bacterium]|nr:MAG: curli assembly protein CsgF [Alteromonadaceae bacterium]
MIRLIWLTCILSTMSISANASELVYTPVNPSFGGSPLNGNFLLNSAQSQNTHKDPALEQEDESPLDDFNKRLQRSLLNRLTSTLSNSFVDEGGNLIPGEIETTDFTVNIVDEGNGTLSVTTTDKISGDSTTFIVNTVL